MEYSPQAQIKEFLALYPVMPLLIFILSNYKWFNNIFETLLSDPIIGFLSEK